MPLTELLHLTHERLLEVIVHHVRLMHLLGLDHISHGVGAVVVFDREENLLLLPHLDQIFAITLLDQESFCDLLLVQSQLLFLLNLELLNQLKCSGLIVTHVLIPGFRELSELQLLSTFNVNKLLFLSQAHVLLLTLLFGTREFLESHFHHFSPSVVSAGLSIDTKLVHDSNIDKIKLVRNAINDLP